MCMLFANLFVNYDYLGLIIFKLFRYESELTIDFYLEKFAYYFAGWNME